MVEPQWGQFQKIVSDATQPLPAQGNVPQTNESSYQEEFKPEQKQVKWGQFQNPSTYQGPINEKDSESTLGYLLRNATANASRLAEQGAGSLGNVEKFTRSSLSKIPATGGILGSAIKELMGQENWDRLIGVDNQMFPTSNQLKEISQKASSGYTAPKTKGEERLQNVTEDVGSTLMTGRPASMRNALINNLGIPLATNAISNIVEDTGFGKDKANIAKMATWTALSLLGNVNAPQHASELMNRGRNGVPNTVQADVPRLQRRLQQVSNSPHLLHADPRSALARQQVTAIERDLANGQTSIQSLMTSYDGINAAKRNRDLFSLTRGDQGFARRAIDEVRNVVRDEILDIGRQYPDAINSWRSGVEAWSTIHRSRAVTNWVQDLAQGPYNKIITGAAAPLFGVTAYSGIKAPLIAGPAALAIPAGYKAAQTIQRVWSNPTLANYYWNAIGAATAENIPAFVNNYNKLNKGLEKSNSSNEAAKSKK